LASLPSIGLTSQDRTKISPALLESITTDLVEIGRLFNRTLAHSPVDG